MASPPGPRAEDRVSAARAEELLRVVLRAAQASNEAWSGCIRPRIGREGRGPDLLLLSRTRGLVVLEVLDRPAEAIGALTPVKLIVDAVEGSAKRANPARAAQEHAAFVAERLREMPALRARAPNRPEGLRVPIHWAVLFPRIRREVFQQRGFQWFIPLEHALLEEDLKQPGAGLARIVTAPPPSAGLDDRVWAALCSLFSPERFIRRPAREGSPGEELSREVGRLDRIQERLALRLGAGHRIIQGPPGSGKTVILVNRLCHLWRYQPRVRKILLVCYNIALAGYLGRLVAAKVGSPDPSRIRVHHFFELCAAILHEPILFENQDAEYYQGVIRKCLRRLKGGPIPPGPFDAVFIDEAQDFGSEMLQIAVGLVRPGGDLVIALDPSQDLYARRRSWQTLGIQARGRTHRLHQSYRNTAEIMTFGTCLIGLKAEGPPEGMLAAALVRHGDPPLLLRFEDQAALESYLVQDLQRALGAEGFAPWETAVIYDDKVYGVDRFSYGTRTLPMRTLERLQAAGLPVTWVSRDARSKAAFAARSERVSLISIHSAKGLDFDLVYLLGVDGLSPGSPRQNRRRLRLLYVAATRARSRLVIPYVRETPLVRRMKACAAAGRGPREIGKGVLLDPPGTGNRPGESRCRRAEPVIR